VEHTLAAARTGVVGAWDDLRVEPGAPLHPDLHPRNPIAAGRALFFLRLAGLVLVDVESALNGRHAGSNALLIVLGVLANAGALGWAFARVRGVGVPAVAIALMGCAGGLLAALQHGSAALAFPAVAVTQAGADGSVLEAITIGALALMATESGVVWAKLDASAAVGYPALIVGAALVGLTRRQYVAQTLAAEALVAQTRRSEALGRRAAALDERTRLAREIHDVLAHALGGLSVQLEAAEMLLSERGDIEGALERIRGSRRTAREGLEEARRAVAALRSDAPPLRQTLTGLVASHREQGSGGELVVEGATRELAPEVSLALMRTVQEALTNARRHAPGSAVRVHLIYEPERTSVTVTNDQGTRSESPAPEAATGGYGLTGMRERLELAGGRLSAGPSEDGWSVTGEIPG
jgi:signal transduction histidine kinase